MRQLLPPVLAFLLSVFAHTDCLATRVRTLNLDFGNGEQYVGDDGVLSSSGGTYWNKVSIFESTRVGNHFDYDGFYLLDEFGNRFPGLSFTGIYPEVIGRNIEAWDAPASQSFEGPMSDGVLIDGDARGSNGILIREMSRDVPIEVVVYFAQPSSVHITEGFNDKPGTETNAFGSSTFPGTEGEGHVRYQDITADITTLGFPELPGFSVIVPENSGMIPAPIYRNATITAMQVRGVFYEIPEPTAACLVLLIVTGNLTFRMQRQ